MRGSTEHAGSTPSRLLDRRFHWGAQVVQPKREKLKAAERALKEANKKLEDKQAALKVRRCP